MGQAGEVSLSRGERLLVSSEESPKGWVIGARAVDPSVVGYVPLTCVQTPRSLLAAAAQRSQASLVNNRDDTNADDERHLYDGGGGVGGGVGVGGAAPASPVRPLERLQVQARLLNLGVEAQLPSRDPVADLMAQLPRGDPAEVARKVARHREARAAALQDPPPRQGSASSSSLDVLLSRNGLLQSEEGGLLQS